MVNEGTGLGGVRHLAVPHAVGTEVIDNSLRKSGVIIASSTGTRIGELVKNRKSIENSEKGVIYQIPCGGCDLSYYGESGRDVSTRINEHKRDIRAHRLSNSLVVHAEEHDHLPNWSEVKLLHKGMSKRDRRITEAAYIISNRSTNHRDGFYRLANSAARMIIEEEKGKGSSTVDQPQPRRRNRPGT